MREAQVRGCAPDEASLAGSAAPSPSDQIDIDDARVDAEAGRPPAASRTDHFQIPAAMPERVRFVREWHVLRARARSALHVVCIGVIGLVGSARAENTPPPGTLFEMPLPGDIRRALASVDDGVAADRSQVLVELIRRSYHRPAGGKQYQRDLFLGSVLAPLDLSSGQSAALDDPPETLPLPLPPRIWIDLVFGGRTTSQSLAGEILRSRNAALLYSGLLSLDDHTRYWLTTQPDLIAELASRHAAAFLVAAPGLRVTEGAVRVPGGASAESAWEALAGVHPSAPADFVRALLAHGAGRLAYFFGAMAQLTPAEIRFALNLDSPDAAVRAAAARQLHAIFEHMAPTWKIEEQPFWRPALDPALLVADLRLEDDGRPALPGTRRFWNLVFADAGPNRTRPGRADDFRAAAHGESVDFAWLCEQVFKGEPGEQRRRYRLVLFASRTVRGVTPATVEDAIETVRAAGTYPALIAALERAKVSDVATFASAARRAAQLSAIRSHPRAIRALAQFQGALGLVTRAALRGSLPIDSLPEYVSSLSAVDLSHRGDYEGRLVRWLDEHLREPDRTAAMAAAVADSHDALYGYAAGPIERDLLRMLAGPAPVEPRYVDWEGTRYRLDVTHAEAARLARLIGGEARPYLTSARALVLIADALDEGGLDAAGLEREAGTFGQVAQALALDEAAGWDGTGVPRRYRQVDAALRRAARGGDARSATRLGPALRVLADDLLARGLLELAYAAALGHPERAPISANEAARRHDFGLRSPGWGRNGPWQLPVAGTDSVRGWRVTGSLLGLDVKLAEFSLIRLSWKLPARKPTLSEVDRRVLTEAVALVEPMSLTDADRDTIVAALRNGRARLAAARTPREAYALADEIRLGPVRRTLLPWVVAHDPERVATFLSPIELLWLGLDGMPMAPGLHEWGAPGEPRLGCLCLQMIDRRPWEMLAGRWPSGIFASGFPDLNLRLAELLAELQMPAPLLGPVLASATLDFILTASSRDPDDRRGLVEFVQELGPERLELYLALLTTDGPLVPSGDLAEPAAVRPAGSTGEETEVPR
jgi:hypothetical protein